MELIVAIHAKFADEAFEFSKHATDQALLREITVQEIRDAIADGRVIEVYQDDILGPSCMIFGYTRTGRPLHVQCSYPTRPIVKVLTVYEPMQRRGLIIR